MGRIKKPMAATVSFEGERKIPIDDLEFDFKNNRIIHLEIHGVEELEERLWKEADLGPLKNDIKARGLQEPLILFPNSNKVAEGNCRLVCLKRLHREAKVEAKESENPFEFDPRLKEFLNYKASCKRIAQGTPETDIDVYLTEIHVGRKKKWPEYNQAKLLYKLKFDDDLTIEEIARISRSSRPIVSKKIQAYKYTSNYHELFPKDESFVKWFYYFWEFAHSSLDVFHSESNDKKFMKWIHSDKFSNSKQVRELPKILENPKALKKFEEADMTEAIKIIMKVDPTINSPLYRKISNLALMLKNFPRKELLLAVNDSSRKNALIELKNNTVELLKFINEFEHKENSKN